MYISNAARYLGSVPTTRKATPADWRTACGDIHQGATGGFLIDCARAAGLSGVSRGRATRRRLSGIDQAQLNAISRAYQKRIHPRWLGDSFVYATGPNAGQAVNDVNWVGSDVAPTQSEIAPGPTSILSAPSFISQLSFAPLPQVSAGTLLAAAKLPNAPAIVKQAAAQLSGTSAGQLAGVSDFLSKYGIYLAFGLGGIVLISAMKRRR